METEQEEDEDKINYAGYTQRRYLRIHRVYNKKDQTTVFYYVSAVSL